MRKQYTLKQAVQYDFTYSSATLPEASIYDVVPHRVATQRAETVTVSGIGLPFDANSITAYVGGVRASVRQVRRDTVDQRVAIIELDVPALSVPGLYDLELQLSANGVTQSVRARGAIAADSPLRIESITPRWVPVTGGVIITIKGTGFDPGTSVSDGVKLFVGSIPIVGATVVVHDTIQFVAPPGPVGLNAVRAVDRYGRESVLSRDNGLGYGLRRVATQGASQVYPSDLIVDPKTGVAFTNGGLITEGWVAQKFANLPVPDSVRAASFNLQNPNQPLLVGAASSLPGGDEGRAQIARMVRAYELGQKLVEVGQLSPEEQSELERLKDVTVPTGIDSLRIETNQEWVAGEWRSRLYVANGSGGVARLNLDEQNGLQVLSTVLEEPGYPDGSMQVGDVTRHGYMLYAARAQGVVGGTSLVPCKSGLGDTPASGIVVRLSYLAENDPISLGAAPDMTGTNAVVHDGEWLYAGGQRVGEAWTLDAACILLRKISAAKPHDMNTGVVTATNLADPLLRRSYSFDGNILDLTSYGQYLIAALGSRGVEMVHKNDPSLRIRLPMSEAVQTRVGRAIRLTLRGSTLFVAVERGGLMVYDLSVPDEPRVVSAGNIEHVESADVYKNRLITASSTNGLSVFELPAAMVVAENISRGASIADNEDLIVTFNEPITEGSMRESGTVRVVEQETGSTLTAVVTPIEPVNFSATRYHIQFPRNPGAHYEIKIANARNERGAAMWANYGTLLVAASVGARRPVIHEIRGGAHHRGTAVPLFILGENFTTTTQVLIDATPVTALWKNANEMEISATVLDMLSMADGAHTVTLRDGELTAHVSGGLILAPPPAQAAYSIEPSSGSIEGGQSIKITASASVILPGTRVVLRDHGGTELKTVYDSEGHAQRDLRDDVESLREFRFRASPVDVPQLYDVYLVNGTVETRVGQYSYRLTPGQGIDLPNYPPMVIGAAETVDAHLFIGVKEGAAPTVANRYLMRHGFEIYDIGVRDNPVRVAQLPTATPVTGVAIDGHTAFLAAGRDGLKVLDITDRSRPTITSSVGVAAARATDVAINMSREILALAVASDDGGGYIRFLDANDPEWDPPVGVNTVPLVDGPLRGEPLDIQWRDDTLFILLKRGNRLAVVSYKVFVEPQTYTLQELDHGVAGADASFSVAFGQMVVNTGKEILVLIETHQGAWQLDYWHDGQIANELFRMGGVVYQASKEGVASMQTGTLALTDIQPASGTTLVAGQKVVFRFNQLLNTTPELIAASINVSSGDGAPLPTSAYEVIGVNTLLGGEIQLAFTAPVSTNGPIRIALSAPVSTLNGVAFASQVTINYVLSARSPVAIKRVAREVNGAATQHYFHADGSEIGVIQGSGFGSTSDDVAVRIGDRQLGIGDLLSVTDTVIRFRLPNLVIDANQTSLSVEVKRGELRARVAGALVIAPRVVIEELDPRTGVPHGGNVVNIYGRGFHPGVEVLFGPVKAGDIRVLGQHHLQVRAPAGVFGYADVTVTSPVFDGEKATLSDGYFYAGRETSSAELAKPDSGSNPVTSIAVREQLVYAVTGGSYDAIDRQGTQLGRFTSNTGQLYVMDVSDPLRPVLVQKSSASGLQPYHYQTTLAPEGFRAVRVQDNDLFVVGGDRVLHFDVTLPTSPLLVATLVQPGVVQSVEIYGRLVFVSGDFGVRIYRLRADRTLHLVAEHGAEVIGGGATAMFVAQHSLYVLVPGKHQLVQVELESGEYQRRTPIGLADMAGKSVAATDFVVHGDKIIYATGTTGKVIVAALGSDGRTLPRAEFNLSYLIRNGDLYAGELVLRGQTLLVSAGQGDVQLFDVSPWLENNFTTPIVLNHYYTLLGATNTIATTANAIYAGTAFVYVDDVAVENPLESGSKVSALGGALNTILNDRLSIIDQSPVAGGRLGVEQAVELQFNRILDGGQAGVAVSTWIEVTLNGVPVTGGVVARTSNDGTRLVFRPLDGFAAGKEYRVTASAAITDLAGVRLGAPVSFKFVAEPGVTPTIDTISPALASWRGGEEVEIFGSHFGAETRIELAGIRVAEADILERHPQRLRLRVAARNHAPTQNVVVGVSVANGALEYFEPAAFTFVADPIIEAVGAYDAGTQSVVTQNKRFAYNSGARVAVAGQGLSEITRLTINGLTVVGVERVGTQLLTFALPENMLGRLTLEVSNLPSRADVVGDDSLSIDIPSAVRLNNTYGSTQRNGDLLVTISGKDAKLYSTLGSPTPVFVAAVTALDSISHATLAGHYLVLNVGPSEEIHVYDVANVYLPKAVNRILNQKGHRHQDLAIAGDAFVSRDGTRLHIGQLSGADWQTVELSQPVLDMEVSGRTLYLLFADRLEVRDVNAPENVLSSINHELSAPQSLGLAGRYAYIFSETRVASLVLADGVAGHVLLLQGYAELSGARLAAQQGELLALVHDENGARRLDLYDLNVESDTAGGLAANRLARVEGGDDAVTLRFNHDLVEWLDRGGRYHSAVVPLPNVTAIDPAAKIDTAAALVQLRVAGPTGAWNRTVVNIRRTSDQVVLNGDSRLLGDRLEFRAIGDSYEINQAYHIDLFNPPGEAVRGAPVQFDLNRPLRAAETFDRKEITLQRAAPAVVVVGVSVAVTLTGQQLGQVNRIRVNGVSVPIDDWTRNDAGTSLTFNYMFPTEGIYSVEASSDTEQAVLSGAILATASLSIQSVASNHSQGATKISNAGGNDVVITASGLNGNLSLHWYEAGQGYAPNEQNRIPYAINGNALVFKSPKATVGRSYTVALVKPGTAEQRSAEAALTAIDDTLPLLTSHQAMTQSLPLRLVFSEAMKVAGFSVKTTRLDFGADAETNVTHQFVLAVRDNVIELATAPGYALSDNARYRVELSGIADAAGNAPIGGGVLLGGGHYNNVFSTRDTLSPRNLRLALQSNGELVQSTVIFTRGRSYGLVLTALDNVSLAGDLRFSIRISADGGLSFDQPRSLPVGGTPVFVYDAREAAGVMAFLVGVQDKAGNRVEQRFVATLVEPQVTVGALVTAPALMEELSSAQLSFALSGDVDLVQSAEVQVYNAWRPAAAAVTGTQQGRVTLTVTHPRLSDLTQAPTVPVSLRLVFKSGDVKVVQDRFTLVGDATPPTVSIVSPADGEKIPVNRSVDVLLKAFDRYGVEQVEVQINGGGFVPLSDTSSYRYVPTVTGALSIEARARDLNGNVSAVTAITVQVYEGLESDPQLLLSSPVNGMTFHELEPVSLDVTMRNLTTAEVYLDVGGVAASTAAATLTRNANEPERFTYSLPMPEVVANTIVVVRVQATALKARAYLNVLNDDGIDQEPIIRAIPDQLVLGGTEVWVAGDLPKGMDDFHADSTLSVRDPIANSTAVTIPYAATPQPVAIGNSGVGFDITATLRDRSGHARSLSRQMTKLPYLESEVTPLYVPANADEVFAGMVEVPGLQATGSDLVWAVNLRQGGYALRNASGAWHTSNTGRIERLIFSGTALIAKEVTPTHHAIVLWPWRNGSFGTSERVDTAGTLIGAFGNVVWLRHDRLIDGLHYDQGTWTSIVGAMLPESVRNVVADAQRLFVLTESGIYLYRLGDGEIPTLQKEYFVGLVGAVGLRVFNDRLVTWNSDVLKFYVLNSDGSLTNKGQRSSGGRINQVLADGELWWVAADGPFVDGSWQAYRDTELVGLRRSGISDVLFAANRAYEVVSTDHSFRIDQRRTQASAVVTTLTPQITARPFGYVISGIADADTLGGETTVVLSSAGKPLPAAPYWIDQQMGLWIPRTSLVDSNVTVRKVDRSGGVREHTLLLPVDNLSNVAGGSPDAFGAIARGARIPLSAISGNDASLSDLAVVVSGGRAPLASVDGVRAYQWWQMPEGTTLEWTVVDASGELLRRTINLVANDATPDSITIVQPSNNQAVTEGETIAVAYRATRNTADALRFVELTLEDFNGVVHQRLRAASQSGLLTLHAPAVSEQENMFIRVRAYYGSTYRFSENSIGLRVYPDIGAPDIAVAGLTPEILAGATLDLRVSSTLGAGASGRIALYDNAGTLLASGGLQLSYTVPANISSLRVDVTVTDAAGNTKSKTQTIAIVKRFELRAVARTQPFAAALADVGDTLFARGRSLVNRSGQVVATLEADIDAMARAGSRLLVAARGLGLLMLDVTNGYTVLSQHAVTGRITALAVLEHRAVAIVDNRAQAFELAGTAFTPKAMLSVSGAAQQVLSRGTQFIVRSDQEIVAFNGDFAVAWRVAAPFTAMSVLDAAVAAVDTAGVLHWIDAMGRDTKHALGLEGQRIISLADHLLVLSAAKQSVAVVDVALASRPLALGRLALSLGNSVENAILSGGQLWTGGEIGSVFVLNRIDASARELFRTVRPRGDVTDVAIDAGDVVAAANHFGAVEIAPTFSGTWTDSVYPAAYAEATAAVAVGEGERYYAQSGLQRVIKRDSDGRASTVFKGASFSRVELTANVIVATAGSRLYVAERSNPTNQYIVEPVVGQDIKHLSVMGEVAYAALASNAVYRVGLGNRTAGATVVGAIAMTQLRHPIEHIAVTSDYLHIVSNGALQRIRLADLAVSEHALSASVTGIGVGTGRVFVAYGADIDVYDVNTFAKTNLHITAPHSVSSIAVDGRILALGLRDGGVAIVELPLSNLSLDAGLITPPVDAVYIPGQTLNWRVANGTFGTAARLMVNDKMQLVDSDAPFDRPLLVPPYLPNGKVFTLHAEVETIWGELVRGLGHPASLQGDGAPINPFQVSVALANLYLPRPLEVRASITNSTQPVQQVEFFYATASTGPFERFGIHYGPEYVIGQNFTAGGYIKARATDVFGNVAESPPTRFVRLADPFAPVATITVTGATMNGAYAAGQPYTVTVAATDAGSGVDVVMMYRNGLVVAADFGTGSLAYVDSAPAAGAQIQYTVTVVDKSGNEGSVAKSVSVVSDNAPVVASVAVPTSINEKQSFKVNVVANDDFGLKKVVLRWNGSNYTQNVAVGVKNLNYTFTIQDTRATRLTAQTSETLVVEAHDTLGQVTQHSATVAVMPDTRPNASALNVSYTASGFYDSTLPIVVSGLSRADDGGFSNLTVSLIEINGSVQRVAASTSGLTGDLWQTAVKTSLSDVQGDTYRFKVQLLDRQGQSAETGVFSVSLTQLPSRIMFDTGRDSALNRSVIAASENAPYQVRVLDSAGRGVGYQRVTWQVTNNEGALAETVTTTTSNTGYAGLAFNSLRAAGQYHVQARLESFPFLSAAAMSVDVLPGPVARIDFDYIAPATAARSVTLRINAKDAAGNRITAVTNDQFTLETTDPAFHFGFAGNIAIETRYGSAGPIGERATVSLVNGNAEVTLAIGTRAGTYPVTIGYPRNIYISLYDQDNSVQTPPVNVSVLPVTILPAAPARFAFELREKTNHALGDSAVLEAGETATVELRLIDGFGNLVDTVERVDGSRHDANYAIDVSAGGAARVNAAVAPQRLSMQRGRAVFTVNDESAESVDIGTVRVDPQPMLLAIDTKITLNFIKRRPAVKAAAFEETLNNVNSPLALEFTEPVYNGGDGAAVEVSLNGQIVPATTLISGSKVHVTLSNTVELNRCYRYDTTRSSLRGIEKQDAVLPQTADVCSPQVAIPVRTRTYFLELETVSLELLFGQGVDRGGISQGTVQLDDQTLAFNWQTGSVTLPDRKAAAKSDGAPAMLHLTGRYQDQALRMANGIHMPLLWRDGDIDQDGLSNAVEHNLGYNPLSADSDSDSINDGNEDFDGDGVSNRDEITLSTLIDRADSDGDGLSDGQELNTTHTNPLLADSDGDGAPDGMEVAHGGDPNNAANTRIDPAAITALVISPTAFDLDINQITGPIQVTATATVTFNGTNFSVNVTDPVVAGIVYQSSNTLVATLGTMPGTFNIVGKGTGQLLATLNNITKSASLRVVGAVNVGNVQWINQTVSFTDDVRAQSVVMQAATFTSALSLESTGDFTVNSGTSQITAKSLRVGGNLIVDSADFFLALDAPIEVGGNVIVRNNARLRVPLADSTLGKIYPLEFNVAGDMSVLDTSQLYMDLRGYWSAYFSGPDFSYNTRLGCYGGKRDYGLGASQSDCSYGDYRRARWGGSAGQTNLSQGGGFVSISARQLTLSGVISAWGRDGGAGGGVHLDVQTLLGAGTIAAHSSGSSYSGGGGRVSIYSADRSQFTGAVKAHGSYYYVNSLTTRTGGAGSIYYYDKSAGKAHLVANNNNYAAPDGSTPIRSVGRHTITAVTALGNSRWEIARGVDSSLYRVFEDATSDTPDGSVRFHRFTLTADRTVEFMYRGTMTAASVHVFRDDGTLDVADHVGETTFNSGYVRSMNLASGNYVVAFSRGNFTRDEAIAGSNRDTNTYGWGAYRLRVETTGGAWRNAAAGLDWGLIGNKIALDADNPTVPLYTIVDNKEETLVIESADNVSGYVGKALIGVHEFETINITGGARVSFGADRVVVNDLTNSNVDSTSRIHAGLLQTGAVVLTKTLYLDKTPLRFSGDVVIDGATYSWSSSQPIEVNGNLTVKNNATLTIQSPLIVRGDLRLESTGRLQPAVASGTAWPVALDVTVTGTLTIDATSMLSATGAGYPANWSGPEFVYGLRSSCYGGIRDDNLNPGGDCSYGDYRRVRFPGSGGQNAAGGGLVTVRAGTLDVAGKIEANSNSDGAAGGIHVVVDVLRGSGTIEASSTTGFYASNGSSYRIPSGGRVAIVARDRSGFTGTTLAYGGLYSSIKYGGAGTVYLTTPGASVGHLVVKARSSLTPDASTPMRRVGRHVISSVENLGNQRWRISRGPDSGVYQWLTGSIADSGAGSVAYHRFTLTQPRTVRLDYRSTTNTGYAQIFRDDGSLHASDLITGDTFGTNTSFNLPAGSFVMALSRPALTVDEAVTGQNNDGVSAGSFRDYSILLQTLGGTWHTSAPDYDWGLDGMQVSLDAANPNAPLYTIVSNTEESITVSSTDNLSGAAGKELIGVQTFETVNIIGGAKVDFGGDRVIVNDWANSNIDSSSKMKVGVLRLSTTTFTKSNRFDAEKIIVDGNVVIDGAQNWWTSNQPIEVNGNLTVKNNVALNVQSPLIVRGDLRLENGGKIQPVAVNGTALPVALDVTVTGTLAIDATSSLNASNMGYPSNWSGSEYVYSLRNGCYGGVRYDTLAPPGDCTYGDYRRVRFPGSGGSNGAGGGLINVKAGTLDVAGAIQANNTSTDGAGGGIQIEVDVLRGNGTIEASSTTGYQFIGGNYRIPGGGRVAIVARDRSGFTGNTLAYGQCH